MHLLKSLLVVGVLLGCEKRSHVSSGPKAKLEVLLVDDANDPLAKMDKEPLPAGVGVLTEGAFREGIVHYAYVIQDHGETVLQAGKRLTDALASQALPAGDHLVIGSTTFSVRSYLVKGAPVITEANVVDAVTAKDSSTGHYSVSLTVDPPGAMSIESTTKTNVGWRMAIIVDGIVQSAPIIRSTITGGHVQITLGGLASTNDEKIQADRLTKSFNGQ